MRGEQFFFQAADGQNLAAKRDFAGHGQVATYWNFAQGAGDGGGNGDACRGPVLRNGALRNVHVQVKIAIEIAAQTEALRTRSNVRHRRLG